jgi:hypothetical protein
MFSTAVLATATLTALPACKGTGKASEERASQSVAKLTARATEDIAEIQRGLPVGAAQLTPLFANGSDPSQDFAAVRLDLRRIRANVPDLARSNATFFALSDVHGIAIRNDLDEDVMAGQDVLKLFPELRKVTADGSVVSATGLFGGARAPGEPDRDWVAATALKDEQGHFGGLLLTGWTFRRFTFHLQEVLRHDLTAEQAKTDDPGKLPIVYVCIFGRNGVIAPPLTPAVNEKALVDLDLVTKTAAGPAHGVLNITDRDFGYAAARVPALEPDAGIVVLWSEI